MNKRAAHRSDEEWHQIILAARASGLNDFEYCRTNGIPRSTCTGHWPDYGRKPVSSRADPKGPSAGRRLFR